MSLSQDDDDDDDGGKDGGKGGDDDDDRRQRWRIGSLFIEALLFGDTLESGR
jgi:hypothetical protein